MRVTLWSLDTATEQARNWSMTYLDYVPGIRVHESQERLERALHIAENPFFLLLSNNQPFWYVYVCCADHLVRWLTRHALKLRGAGSGASLPSPTQNTRVGGKPRWSTTRPTRDHGNLARSRYVRGVCDVVRASSVSRVSWLVFHGSCFVFRLDR